MDLENFCALALGNIDVTGVNWVLEKEMRLEKMCSNQTTRAPNAMLMTLKTL